jgi:glycosyltransferase involved in cell wall biosynthesis
MRIAQVAPLLEAVPPPGYGGIERMVSYVTEEQVALGHEVTLFASGDSVTNARLAPGCRRALRSDDGCQDPLPYLLRMLHHVADEADAFDVVHFHTGYTHLPLAWRDHQRSLTTLHDRMDRPDIRELYRTFRSLPYVSISLAQREPMRWLNWIGTVHHGIPADLYELKESAGDYLAFVGRMSREKGVEAALEISRRTGVPLRIAAKIGHEDRGYFEGVVRPQLAHPLVEYVGEISDAGKQEFLGGALALLFPVDWPEPFGLVMIEAMACGTPVIAFPRGSVPEVVDHGRTGLIAESVGQAVAAVREVERLDRRRCREVFERRFTSRRMAEDYLAIYERLTEGARHRRKETGYRARRAGRRAVQQPPG